MGLEIEIIDHDPYLFYTEKEVDGNKISVVLAHFLTKKINEITPGNDILEWRWIDINDLEKENLAPNIIPTLSHFGFIK